MHTVKINNDEYRLPSCWDDLTPRQLRFLVRLTQREISLEHLKIYMMLYCLNARVANDRRIWGRTLQLRLGIENTHTRLRIGWKKYDLLPEEVVALSGLMGFLIERERTVQRPDYPYFKNSDRYYIKPDLLDNPYPKLRIRLHRFTGPDVGLFDITFEQYVYLQTYLDAMREEPQKIDWVLACVWHRGKSFDINRLERDAALLHRLAADRKMVMYWFVSSCLSNFGEMFPRLFTGGEKRVKNNVLDSQLRLLDSLANHDMTKKDAVRQGLLIDALYAMDESVREKEELEERMKG